MYRAKLYRGDCTSVKEFVYWEDAADYVDDEVDAGRASGGNVEEYVYGFGWVLCNDR